MCPIYKNFPPKMRLRSGACWRVPRPWGKQLISAITSNSTSYQVFYPSSGKLTGTHVKCRSCMDTSKAKEIWSTLDLKSWFRVFIVYSAGHIVLFVNIFIIWYNVSYIKYDSTHFDKYFPFFLCVQFVSISICISLSLFLSLYLSTA